MSETTKIIVMKDSATDEMVAPRTTPEAAGALPAKLGTKGELLGFIENDIVGAVSAPDVSGAVSQHNVDATAHADIREALGNVSGKRTCRFVVGTAAAGWTKNDCDYLCDGLNDQEEINAAVQALPGTGGEIVILDGVYYISAKIEVNKPSVKLLGNGNGTVLKRMWKNNLIQGVIDVSDRYCSIENLSVDGNKNLYDSPYAYGIHIHGAGCIVSGNQCFNNYGMAINCTAGSCIIKNNYCYNSKVGVNSNGLGCIISGNICNNNVNGIISAGADSTIAGNLCNNAEEEGIGCQGSNTTIFGNTCNDFGVWGIYGGCECCTIIGNTAIRLSGQPTNYTDSQNTIFLFEAKNCLIANNNIMGKNYTDRSGSNNTFVNNKFE